MNGLRMVTLEEHVATPQYPAAGHGGAFEQAFAKAVAERLADTGDGRLRDLDEAGIDVQVLSLSSPTVQGEPDPAVAVDNARRANDALAEAVAAHPELSVPVRGVRVRVPPQGTAHRGAAGRDLLRQRRPPARPAPGRRLRRRLG